MGIPKTFISKIIEYKSIGQEIEELTEERKSKTAELKQKVKKIEAVYKEKISKLEESKDKLKSFIVSNWQKYIEGKKIDVEGKTVTKVSRVEIEVTNKQEVVKLLLLMKREDLIEFNTSKIRELVKIGSIPKEYIKESDNSYITFSKK